MPFVPQENRKKIQKSGAWETVGDLCYMKYLPMVKAWKASRRWTTFHNITKVAFDIDDEKAAKLLAWMVFFVDEVMEYEREKKHENGPVE